MREQLIGYLLEALEPHEHQAVAVELERNDQLKHELELLSRALQPLAADRQMHEPPRGLAERTCHYVVERTTQITIPMPAPQDSSRWSLADMVVAAGIFVAAGLLFFPAMSQSRFAAKLTQCQNNLRQVGMAMHHYSQIHNDFFPLVPLEGKQSAAGVVPVRLRALGFLDGSHLVVCPASVLADEGDFRMPSLEELEAADAPTLVRLQARMGGSYAYGLGYVSGGQYHPARNMHRVRFAIVADAPTTAAPFHSTNHKGCGQNVLFEDGHVQYLTTCKAHGCTDHIYTNDRGQVGPGLSLNDAVLGSSHIQPKISAELLNAGSKD